MSPNAAPAPAGRNAGPVLLRTRPPLCTMTPRVVLHVVAPDLSPIRNGQFLRLASSPTLRHKNLALGPHGLAPQELGFTYVSP